MNLVDRLKDMQRYQRKWDATFESIISTCSERDKFNFRAKNIERRGLGLAGYAARMSAEVLELDMDEEAKDLASLLNSVMIFSYGIPDDKMDAGNLSGSEAGRVLDDFYMFLETGRGFDSLLPFREFLRTHLSRGAWEEFLQTSDKYIRGDMKSALSTRDYDILRESRISIGRSQAELFALVFDDLSRKLSNQERNFLANYFIACSLMDCVSDYHQDRLRSENTHVSVRVDDGERLGKVLIQERDFSSSYFDKARVCLNGRQLAAYDELVNLTKTYYLISFFKKMCRRALEPVIFTQYRVGHDEKPIKIYKIKTMRDCVSETLPAADNFRVCPDYSRTTPIGRFLRRFWIDEFPNLINIVKGDMSLVGMRALTYDEFEKLPGDIKETRRVSKPGMVHAPYYYMNSGMGKWEAQRTYLSEKSFLTDVKCLFGIFGAYLTGRLRGL